MSNTPDNPRDDAAPSKATSKKQRYCAALDQHGNPCSAYHGRDSDFCFFHSPHKAEQQALARQKANRRSLAGLPGTVAPRNPADLATLMSDVLAGVLSGTVDPRVANSASYVANQLIKSLELSQLDSRVRALEKLAGKHVIERPAEDAQKHNGSVIDADSHPIEEEENA